MLIGERERGRVRDRNRDREEGNERKRGKEEEGGERWRGRDGLVELISFLCIGRLCNVK